MLVAKGYSCRVLIGRQAARESSRPTDLPALAPKVRIISTRRTATAEADRTFFDSGSIGVLRSAANVVSVAEALEAG